MRSLPWAAEAVALLALLLTASPVPAHGQDAGGGPAPPARRFDGAFRLDGRSDEPGWANVPPLRLVTHTPTAGDPPRHPSEIRIAYDETYLYAAARFTVGKGEAPRSSSLTRDRLAADDVFRLILDTFDDNESALGFATNPAGVRVDFAISGDGERVNLDWNTYWDVATVRSDTGWFAEMRIPWSSLRFQDFDGRVVIGVIAARYTASSNELATYPSLSPSAANAPFRPSLAGQFVFAGVRPLRPLYVTPYALGGLRRDAAPSVPGGAITHVSDATMEAGLDLKYGVSSNLTLDLTVNTDFAHVEADDEQVNLTQFPLFFPEKRQFFQERGGLFDMPTGTGGAEPSLFFHSRRIGLENGQPLRMYGGARLVGRIGGWDLGVLDLHTATPVPGVTENVGVARLRRRVVNDESTIGAAVTTRVPSAGVTNVAYELDGRIRATGTDYLTLQWAQSFDEGSRSGAFDGGLARVAWTRPGTLTSQGLGYEAGVKWSGPAFNPGLGFQPRSDFHRLWLNVRYGVHPGARTFLRSIQPSGALSLYRRNADRSVESGFAAGFLNFEFKSGLSGWVGGMRRIEDLRAPLALPSETVAPACRHVFTVLQAAVFPASGDRFGLAVDGEVGGFYDGRIVAVTVTPTWNVNEHLELQLDYVVQRVRFSDRNQGFDADILRLRARAAVDTRWSASAVVQYNQAADAIRSSIRLRYHVGESRDLYLVYDELLAADPEGGGFTASLNRSVLVKYSHSFLP